MRKYFILVMSMYIGISTLVGNAHAFFKSAKVTLVVVDETGQPIEGVNAGVGFERNTGWGTDSSAKRGLTDENGFFTATGSCNGHIGYGAIKDGYYRSHYDYDFKNLGILGWQPWDPVLKIVMRKIENPVPMYARDTKFSRIKIPAVGKDVGFDLIIFDWVSPYGVGEYADFVINLNSMVESVKKYNFSATIKFYGFNGIIEHMEDMENGSQYKLPRFAPESGYKYQIITYDKAEPKKNRDVSWKDDRHYIFRVRSVVDKNNKLVKAMYGKVVGDFHLGPQKDGTAFIEFKYYLNPDYTRNLEFDPKRNLFGNLTDLEQVKEP